jgi:hypothetical protein
MTIGPNILILQPLNPVLNPVHLAEIPTLSGDATCQLSSLAIGDTDFVSSCGGCAPAPRSTSA